MSFPSLREAGRGRMRTHVIELLLLNLQLGEMCRSSYGSFSWMLLSLFFFLFCHDAGSIVRAYLLRFSQRHLEARSPHASRGSLLTHNQT